MSSSPGRLDTAALTTLAHPLRARLLTALRLGGPATATDLAERLDTNTGATSYHLRKLAAVGLVSDTGRGEGRRREWEAAARYTTYEPSDFADDPDGAAALAWLERHSFELLASQVHAWHEAKPAWPPAWQDAAGMSDDIVTVTADQMRTLAAELWEVITRHRDDGAGDPAARRVSIHVLGTPLDTQEIPHR